MNFKKVKTVALFILVVLLIGDIFLFLFLQRHNVGFSPKQDVSFSHKTHSGKFGISCLFCHTNAETHSYANLPTTKDCMICHIALKTESELLKAIIYSYDSVNSVVYKKVYDLPDYVRFSHSAHLRSGIDCATCHGAVEQMDSIYLVRPLTMGWCVDCHKEPFRYVVAPREISGIFYVTDTTSIGIAQNEFEIFKNTKAKMNTNFFLRSKKLGPTSIECSTCHY